MLRRANWHFFSPTYRINSIDWPSDYQYELKECPTVQTHNYVNLQTDQFCKILEQTSIANFTDRSVMHTLQTDQPSNFKYRPASFKLKGRPGLQTLWKGQPCKLYRQSALQNLQTDQIANCTDRPSLQTLHTDHPANFTYRTTCKLYRLTSFAIFTYRPPCKLYMQTNLQTLQTN